MVAGKMTKWNGKLVGWDVNKLIRDVQKARDKVLARLRGPDPQGRFIPKGNNSENPYRPNFFGSCCDMARTPTHRATCTGHKRPRHSLMIGAARAKFPWAVFSL